MKRRIFSGLGIAGLLMLATAAGCAYVAVHDGNVAAGTLAVILTFFGADATFFEMSYIWTNGGLKNRYKAWKLSRRWDVHLLPHLRQMLNQDYDWLCHDKTICTLLERYKDAASHDWYTKHFKPINKLRDELNLDPYDPRPRTSVVVYRINHQTGEKVYVNITLIPYTVNEKDYEGYALSLKKRLQDKAKEEPSAFWSWGYDLVKTNIPTI